MDIKIEELNIKNNIMKYIKFGSGKKTFIIIPGLSINSVLNSKDIIAKQYEVFNKEYTTYVFDRVETLNDNYSIFDMADDLYQAISKLNLDNIYVFGASQGGMIAMVLAYKYPNLIKKLVLGSTTPVVSNNSSKLFNEWINLAKEEKTEELYLTFSKLLYPEDIYNKSIDLIKDLASKTPKSDLDRFIILAKSIIDFNIIDKIDLIKCDTLLIYDKSDKLFNDISIVKNSINNNLFNYYEYNGYGHAVYDLAPDYKDIIIKFFMI